MIRNTVGVILCALLLTSCSWLEDWPPSSSKGPDSSSVRIVQQESGSYIVEEGRAPAPPVLPQTNSNDDKLTPMYQSAPSPSVEERLAMLEENVLHIQSTISVMQPSLERFAGLEASLQRIMDELEPASGGRITAYRNEEAIPNQPQNILDQHDRQDTPRPVVTASVQAKPATAYIRSVRIGEHPGKTRIVMDASNDIDFNIHNETQGHVLVIDLPATGWDATPALEVLNSPLIEGYEVQADGNGGSRLFVSLRQDVRVLWAEILKPVGDSGHRIVIDLAAS